LDVLADRALAETLCGDGDLDCGLLAAWPSAVRRRALRQWVRQRAGLTELTYRHLVALEDGVMHGGPGYAVRLPGGTDAVRTGRRLRLPAPRATRV
jgi:tRNA(Ile)-lysidine synthase